MKKTTKSGTARSATTTRKRAAPNKPDLAVAEPEHVASQFGLETLLDRPIYLTRSEWLNHVPFAFWLIEAARPGTVVELGTQSGVSYFAFCQAAQRLKLDVDCFAIGDWPEDAAGTSQFAALERHNAAYYSAFSRILRGSVEEMPQYFEAQSIDMLHIDGQSSFHTIRTAFESWQPILSDQAVVLIHGSDLRGQGFGVRRFLETLQDDVPMFHFRHGQGLVVIGIGKNQPEPLRRLFDVAKHPSARTAVQTIFGQFGRACGDSYLVQEYQELYQQGQRQIEALHEQLDQVLAQVSTPPPVLIEKDPPVPLLEKVVDPEFERYGDAPQQAPDPDPVPDPVSDSGPNSGQDSGVDHGAAFEAQEARIAALEAELKAAQAAAAAVPAPSVPAPAPAAPPAPAADVADVAALRDRAQQLEADLSDRFNEIAVLTQMIQQLEAEKSGGQWQAQNLNHEAEVIRLTQVIGQKEKALKELRHLHAEEQEMHAEWERMYNAVLRSTSWRLTAPLRKVMHLFRR